MHKKVNTDRRTHTHTHTHNVCPTAINVINKGIVIFYRIGLRSYKI